MRHATGTRTADLCLIRMSELFPRHVVITVSEEDFRGYRRKGEGGNSFAHTAAGAGRPYKNFLSERFGRR